MNDLTQQDWFKAQPTQAVMKALQADRQMARFVGGCVRDALFGRSVHDIDIATIHRPQRTMELLEEAGIKAIPTGINHGTITALCAGQSFEVTTLRSDVSTDGRRAVVRFSDDWVEDAARRDFTFNALSVGLDGVVFDPFDGVSDLKAGCVRFVGDAEQRIREDYLRLLRYFRFSAYYGKGDIDPAALEACRKLASGVKTLSGERISQEMLRLLGAPEPAPWLVLMKENGILQHLLPYDSDFAALERLCSLEHKPDAIRRLALLLPQDQDEITALAKRWRLSNDQRTRLLHARMPTRNFELRLDEENLRALLYRKGAQAVRDEVLIDWALAGLRVLGPKEDTVMSAIDQWERNPVEFPLKGRDLIAQGFEPGPEIGAVLKGVEDWWCSKGCRANFEDCLKEAVRIGRSDE